MLVFFRSAWKVDTATFANIESSVSTSIHSWNGLRVSLRRSAVSEAAERSLSVTAT
jgi:hypothetical protein